MKLEDIVKTEQEIKDMGYSIENNIIKCVDVNTIAHFGNCTCLEIRCSDVYPMSSYNDTHNLGYLIRAFVELLDISREDGLQLSNVKNIPCRLIFSGRRCIGFGAFMDNKFVLTEQFAKVDE